MGFVKRAWKGEARLWTVFWLCGFLGQFAWGALAIVALKAGIVGAAIFSIAIIAYSVWLLVASWRCSKNTNWKIWGILVRIIIILNIAFLLVGGISVLNKKLHPGTSIPAISTLNRAIYGRQSFQALPAGAPAPTPTPSDPCVRRLIDIAKANGNTSEQIQQYIATSQPWIAQCHQAAAASQQPKPQ